FFIIRILSSEVFILSLLDALPISSEPVASEAVVSASASFSSVAVDAGSAPAFAPAPASTAAAALAPVRRSRSETAWGTTGLAFRSEEHTSELQSREKLVCRLLLEK